MSAQIPLSRSEKLAVRLVLASFITIASFCMWLALSHPKTHLLLKYGRAINDTIKLKTK